jgi:hypothetical protein
VRRILFSIRARSSSTQRVNVGTTFCRKSGIFSGYIQMQEPTNEFGAPNVSRMDWRCKKKLAEMKSLILG